MTESNAGQRKMTRRLRPTSSGMHDAIMSIRQFPNNDAVSKARLSEAKPVKQDAVVRRATKKQIKTRETRAWKRGEA